MTSPTTDQRRVQIVDAAARLFEEKGYHDTAMDDIAQAVALRKTTLYHYVKSKGELVVWIHNHVSLRLLDNLEKNVAQEIGPREGLREVVADILELMDRKPGYLKVFFEHHREIPDPLREETRKKRDRYQELVESLIQAGIDNGIFRPVDVRLATLALFGITNWSYQWYRPGGPLNYSEVADRLLDVYLRGLEPRT